MNLLKNELRQKLKSSRLLLSPDDRQTKSLKIEEHLKSVINWSSVNTIHIYEPILSLGEVDISKFSADLKSRHPNIDIFTSRMYDNNWQLTRVNPGSIIQDPKFDVVIVPMLGFDENLRRIGYGGGYYDKFLSSQPQAVKIGICFEDGKVAQIPFEIHDVSMNAVVTEHKIYH